MEVKYIKGSKLKSFSHTLPATKQIIQKLKAYELIADVN